MKKTKYIISASVLLLLFGFYLFGNNSKTNKNLKSELPEIAMINPTLISQEPYDKFENAKVITITKKTGDSDFLKIMEDLKKENIDVIFSNVKRNENNLITNIDITISKNGNTKEFSANNKYGIYPVTIKIKDDLISITDKNSDFFNFNNGFSEEDEIAQIQKMMQQQMQMLKQFNSRNSIANDPFFNSFFDINPFGNDDSLQKMMEAVKNNNFIRNLQNSNSDTYTRMETKYIVNGKEMTEEEYKKMDKSKIRSLQIYKSTVTEQKYTN